jgi:putative endonuclease
MSSDTGVLYTGVTNDLARRVEEHKGGEVPGFTRKYKIKRLVYAEMFDDPGYAIAREKQIKGWLRRKKLELIRSENPKFEDLSLSWFR